MSIKKLKMSPDECIKSLEEAASELGISVLDIEKKSESLKNINIGRDGEENGLISMYITGTDGLTLSESPNKNKALNELLLKHFEEKVQNKKVKNMWASYNVPQKDINRIKNIIDNISEVNKYKVTPSTKPHSYYFLEIQHPQRNEKITIQQFNTGKLMLQGKSWEMWDHICMHLETELNTSSQDVVLRMFSNFGEDDETITAVITDKLIPKSEQEIKTLLSDDLFNYLSSHDKDAVVSCQCILNSELPLPTFSSSIYNASFALDGYLKQQLARVGACTTTDTRSENWRYGVYFNNISPAQVTNVVKNALKNDATSLIKEQELLKLYKLLKDYRDPISHSAPIGTRSAHSYSLIEAKRIVKEIVDTMRIAHSKLMR